MWFRFTLPVENTLRSFREKAKTQAYLTAVPQMQPSNGHFTAQGSYSYHFSNNNNKINYLGAANTLTIEIKRCLSLVAKNPSMQANAYVAFRFYDSDDFTTPTIPSLLYTSHLN